MKEIRFSCKNKLGVEGKYYVRLYRPAGKLPVLVATELKDNHGASITNAAETVAEEACSRTGVGQDVARINPDSFVWIEHYPPRSGRDQDDFDLVRFATAGSHLTSPTWIHLTPKRVEEFTGVAYSEVAYSEHAADERDEQAVVAAFDKVMDDISTAEPKPIVPPDGWIG